MSVYTENIVVKITLELYLFSLFFSFFFCKAGLYRNCTHEEDIMVFLHVSSPQLFTFSVVQE